MKSKEWPFDQGPNVAAITSTHITTGNLPILLITHYEDDHSWGFQSGRPVTMKEAQVVAMNEIYKIDPTVAELADLPPGWSAERSSLSEIWVRTKDEWDDEEK